MNATTVPQTSTAPLSLKAALRLDAVVSGANAVAYLALAGVLDGGLGVDAAVLRGVGAFFVVFVAFVWWTSTAPKRAAVLAIVLGNAVWALDSLAVAAFQWGTPSDVGTAWIVAQAAVVGGFAALQWTAWTRRQATDG